jgi:ABC-type lipoprotein release transport system permease subunit
MERNMVASATESFLGEGQIHREGFRESFAVEKTIANQEEVVARLQQDNLVDRFTRRVLSFAMITSPANLTAVSMVGIDPASERHLSQIDEAIISGTYFEGDNRRDIVIGSKLAEILEVDIGSRVVLTVAQAHSGDLSQEMFRVSGIYHFNVKEMDRAMVFVRLPQSQHMLDLGDEVHEIVLRLNDGSLGRDRSLPIWERYSQNGNEAVSWTVLLPEVEAAFELSGFATWIIGLILFGVVALGIINTLFMSLHERMFEFGVLRAVGTRAFAMARLILLEAGALAALSIILGAILGFLVTYVTMKIGINYTGIEFSGVTFRKLLYPVLEVKQFIVYPLAVFVFTTLAGLYPAVFAAKITPAKAMRRSF